MRYLQKVLIFLSATSVVICNAKSCDLLTKCNVTISNGQTKVDFYSTNKNPLRLHVWREDSPINSSVLVVLEQMTKVTSWQLPYILPTSDSSVVAKYTNTSRILCFDTDETVNKYYSSYDLSSGIENRSFSVALSTLSKENITLFLYVEVFEDFLIRDNTKYDLLVSPSEPIYYSYNFPRQMEEETVTLKVTSDEYACVVVSIQQRLCPVKDFSRERVSGGFYQTVKSKGGLQIWKNLFPNGFYIVFNVKSDNQSCNLEKVPIEQSIFPDKERVKISFEIYNGRTPQDLQVATGLIISMQLAILLLFLACISFWYHLKYQKYKAEIGINNTNNEDKRVKKKEKVMYFVSQIFVIAAFYCLPVLQIMVLYKENVDDSGNLDKCYYNFLCSHPYYFNDFNHMFSNIGYVLFGIAFMIVSFVNHYYIKNAANCGLTRQYGLYYAMGLALILEGVLSCAYHICPNRSNFQFDTSFMYIIIVLVIAKLYQNRHGDKLNELSHLLFFFIAVTVIFVMIQITYESITAVAFYIGAHFSLSVYIGLAYIGIKGYQKSDIENNEVEHEEEEANRENGAKENQEEEAEEQSVLLISTPSSSEIQLLEDSELIKKRTRDEIESKLPFIILEIAINVILTLSSAFVFLSYMDFGTYVLVILLTNGVLYCLYYIWMKKRHKERICKEAIIYGVLSVILWGFAAFFFLDAVTKWSLTPAESRELNSDCIFLGFYDTHDIWHLLSATALFFSFMFLLTLDNDLRKTPTSEIKRF